jgi:hypothetical protein
MKVDLIISPQTVISQPLYDAIKEGGGNVIVRKGIGVYENYVPWWKQVR